MNIWTEPRTVPLVAREAELRCEDDVDAHHSFLNTRTRTTVDHGIEITSEQFPVSLIF